MRTSKCEIKLMTSEYSINKKIAIIGFIGSCVLHGFDFINDTVFVVMIIGIMFIDSFHTERKFIKRKVIDIPINHKAFIEVTYENNIDVIDNPKELKENKDA